jgi:5-methylcytosine-specific restriction enzyme subunit McrC
VTVGSLKAGDDGVFDLTPEQAVAIEREELANVLVGPSEGTYRVKTGSRVGVIVGSDWEIRVSPKLAVPRLMFLLGYAADPRGWRKLVAGFTREDTLFEAIANGFSWHAWWAIERGLLRGYVRREERSAVLRGRILFASQISRGGGLPLPVEVAYDDYTEDILENQIIKSATLLLLRLPRVPRDARRRLQRVRAALELVEPLPDPRRFQLPTDTRFNSGYLPALRLAELILRAASTSDEAGDFRSTTFDYDMNKVFEDFLTTAFREAMRPYGGIVRNQLQARWLDVERRLALRPDLSWWGESRCMAILDAKYKAIDAGVMPNADAYQMLAYLFAFGLQRGYLVYARDSGEESRRHSIRNTDREIVVTAIDVEQEPEVVLAQVRDLAADVAAEAVRDHVAAAD